MFPDTAELTGLDQLLVTILATPAKLQPISCMGVWFLQNNFFQTLRYLDDFFKLCASNGL